MKRVIAVLILLCALVPSALAAPSVDLSGMSMSDLLDLQQQVNAALWASDEWQSVTVPIGVYRVGVDIPAGRWTIWPLEGNYASVEIAKDVTENGLNLGFNEYHGAVIVSESYPYYENGNSTRVTWELKEGFYLSISVASAVFTPPVGNSFTFE